MEGNFFEKALKFASQIHEPVAATVFIVVIAAIILITSILAKKPLTKWAAGTLALAVFVGLLAPLAASTYLKSIGMYHVRVIVLGSDKLPVTDVDVTSSSDEQPKKFQGGWEFDIPPQTRPADGKVVFRASIKSAFLAGSSIVILDKDYYPTITIQLTADSTATVHGIVVDEKNMPVESATVSVTGYPDFVTTSDNGSFVLPAHAADGQMVEVRARKGQLVGSASAPAGHGIVPIIVKRR